MLGEERRRRLARAHGGVADEPAQEREVRRHADDLGLVERRAQPVERVVACPAVRDELGDHRVVREADLVALLDPRIDSNARREAETLEAPRLRQERARVLRVNPHLDRVAVGLAPARSHEELSGRDPELLRDEVEAGDELGDRVLDLDPPVQLEEEELAAVDDELDRSRAPVADRAAKRDGRLVQGVTHGRGESRRRRLLEDLLVAALNRAVALPEGDDVAARVRQELHLDVSGPLEVALEIEGAVTERSPRLALGCLQRVGELARAPHDAHAATATARCRLDDERKPDLVRRAAREHRNAGLTCDPLRLHLVASEPERLGWRADPGEPGGLDRLREVGILGEEAVAGMDRVRAGLLRGPNVLLGLEVARDLDVPRLLSSRAASRGRRLRRRRRYGCRARGRCGRSRTAISPRFATSSFSIGTAPL